MLFLRCSSTRSLRCTPTTTFPASGLCINPFVFYSFTQNFVHALLRRLSFALEILESRFPSHEPRMLCGGVAGKRGAGSGDGGFLPPCVVCRTQRQGFAG